MYGYNPISIFEYFLLSPCLFRYHTPLQSPARSMQAFLLIHHIFALNAWNTSFLSSSCIFFLGTSFGLVNAIWMKASCQIFFWFDPKLSCNVLIIICIMPLFLGLFKAAWSSLMNWNPNQFKNFINTSIKTLSMYLLLYQFKNFLSCFNLHGVACFFSL